MKKMARIPLWLILFWLGGCAHQSSERLADTFLKTKMSPTGAYEIQYINDEALAMAVKKHGPEPVLLALEQKFCDNWGHLDHFRLVGQWEANILDAMESVKSGTGEALLARMTGEAMLEQQQGFREIWMKSHNQAPEDTARKHADP